MFMYFLCIISYCYWVRHNYHATIQSLPTTYSITQRTLSQVRVELLMMQPHVNIQRYHTEHRRPMGSRAAS